MCFSLSELNFALDLLRSGRRVDGRGADEARPVEVSSGCLRQYCGSCVATLNNTRCVCTLTVSINTPESPSVTVDVRSSPLSNLLVGMDRGSKTSSIDISFIQSLCQDSVERAIEDAELELEDKKLCLGLVIVFSSLEMPDAVRTALVAADRTLRTAKIPKPSQGSETKAVETQFVDLHYKPVDVRTSSCGLTDPSPLEYKACQALEVEVKVGGEPVLMRREGLTAVTAVESTGK